MKSDNGREKQKAITVRLPEKDYLRIRDYAKSQEVSMNTIVSDAITEYAEKVARRRALERIRLLQQRQRERREPVGSSVELLREMRADRGKGREGTEE